MLVGSEEVDFLPDSVRQQRLRRRRLIRQGYLLAVCVAGMSVLTYVRHGRIAKAQADLAELQRCQTDTRCQAAMIAPLQRQMADLLVKKRIDEELGSRADGTTVLSELSRRTPPNITLTRLELETVEVNQDNNRRSGLSSRRARKTNSGGAGADGTDKSRRLHLEITGLTPTDVDVANFIGHLSASPLFQDVNMGYMKTIVFRGRTVREFQASCYLAR